MPSGVEEANVDVNIEEMFVFFAKCRPSYSIYLLPEERTHSENIYDLTTAMIVVRQSEWGWERLVWNLMRTTRGMYLEKKGDYINVCRLVQRENIFNYT